MNLSSEHIAPLTAICKCLRRHNFSTRPARAQVRYDNPLTRPNPRPFALALALLLTACKPPEQPAIITIVGAVLMDGDGGPPVSNSVVTIEDGRIRSAGARVNLPVPDFAEKIDGAGKFLVPAWIDVAQLAARGDAVVLRPTDPAAAFDQARRASKPILGDIATQADARLMVDRGAAGLLHMIADTDNIDAAFVTRLRDLHIVFVPMLAQERDPTRLAIARRNTKRLSDGGVPLAVGSNGDIFGEMQALAACGIAPADVLVAATRNGAILLRKSEEGTVDPGKRADLLLLSANPAEAVDNFRRIARTMRDGRWQ